MLPAIRKNAPTVRKHVIDLVNPRFHHFNKPLLLAVLVTLGSCVLLAVMVWNLLQDCKFKSETFQFLSDAVARIEAVPCYCWMSSLWVDVSDEKGESISANTDENNLGFGFGKFDLYLAAPIQPHPCVVYDASADSNLFWKNMCQESECTDQYGKFFRSFVKDMVNVWPNHFEEWACDLSFGTGLVKGFEENHGHLLNETGLQGVSAGVYSVSLKTCPALSTTVGLAFGYVAFLEAFVTVFVILSLRACGVLNANHHHFRTTVLEAAVDMQGVATHVKDAAGSALDEATAGAPTLLEAGVVTNGKDAVGSAKDNSV